MMSRMALDKQIHVHSVDTGHFYTEKEKALHKQNMYIRQERAAIHNQLKDLEKQAKKQGFSDQQIKNIEAIHMRRQDIIDTIYDKNFKELRQSDDILDQIQYWSTLKSYKTFPAKDVKEKLLLRLKRAVDTNVNLAKHEHEDRVKIRCFYEKDLNDTNTVSLFESFLSRTIQAETDMLCEDLVIVQVYYFDIFKDLCFHGMNYCDKDGVITKYRYFTSSAGQIRTKKAVFIK